MFFFIIFALSFLFSFFLLVEEKDKKIVLTLKVLKQMILTKQWCAEHPFAGQNTQHLKLVLASIVSIKGRR